MQLFYKLWNLLCLAMDFHVLEWRKRKVFHMLKFHIPIFINHTSSLYLNITYLFVLLWTTRTLFLLSFILFSCPFLFYRSTTQLSYWQKNTQLSFANFDKYTHSPILNNQRINSSKENSKPIQEDKIEEDQSRIEDDPNWCNKSV